MNKKFLLNFKKIIPSILFLPIFLYFLYFIVSGSNGFLSVINLNKELQNLKKEFDFLEKEKIFLKIKNKGLYVASLDLDTLDEESKKLGYVDSTEIIVLINNE